MVVSELRLLDMAIGIVREEYERAVKMNPRSFSSAHEGWAVLREEVDELWDKVKRNAIKEDLFWEAKQVAAMALRFMVDCVLRAQFAEGRFNGDDEEDGW